MGKRPTKRQKTQEEPDDDSEQDGDFEDQGSGDSDQGSEDDYPEDKEQYSSPSEPHSPETAPKKRSRRAAPPKKAAPKAAKRARRPARPAADRFFEKEAEENSASEDEPGHAAAQAKDAYYDPAALQRKSRAWVDKVEEIERNAQEKENRRVDKERRKAAQLELRARDSSGRDGYDQGDDSGSEPESGEEDAESEGEELYPATDEHRVLPTAKDPKLWQVRVQKGQERTAAMALMRKMIYHARHANPLAILSATNVENLENFIFVEAYKIESVREAISGLAVCYQKIDRVPLHEMTKIYEDQEARLVWPSPN